MKRRTMKARLGELSSALYREIYDMTPRQRGQALKALWGLTSTNCGWCLYEARPLLLDFIRAAGSPRERTARLNASKLASGARAKREKGEGK